ncbi:MAG: hypothetical protein AABW47_01740 [Nanoarchaeota archaeon]
MEYDAEKREIKLDKELNNLDTFVIEFCSLLKDYVIVSGYVSILLGRSRATEDVDLLVPEMTKEAFEIFWKKAFDSGFECVNVLDSEEAFEMLQEHAIRFCKEGVAVPNMEFKMIKNDLDIYSFDNKIKVQLNGDSLFISPLEMQIAFKLFLAADGNEEEINSDKDIEDARHLYKLFLDKINKGELLKMLEKLNINERLKWL